MVVEVERSPTLEFAETIEVRCVDPEDQMSVDSYFFASFHDNERAFNSIQHRLSERPSSDLPSFDSVASLPSEEPVPIRSRTETTTSAASTAASSGLKKLGSVLKPILSKSSAKNDEDDKSSGFSIPFRNKSHKPSNDSDDTLLVDPTSQEEFSDGYPPRQAGTAPAGMDDGKTWAPTWIRKPASKVFGSSPSKSSTKAASSDDRLSLLPTSTRATRSGRGKRASVTEVVEPTIPGHESDYDDSDDDSISPGARARSGSTASTSIRDQSTYSLMSQSEAGQQEEDETERKFKAVFALGDKEELIEREHSIPLR